MFKGTRVPVKALFENLEHGARVDDFLTWFPGVTREQVEAVLQHAELSLAEAFPGERLPDVEDVLLALTGRYYTESELARLFGRERMIQSSLYTAGLAEGEAMGRLEAERELCVALARKHHLTVFDRAKPMIEACGDPARLKEWALAASDLSDAEFLNLLGA